MTVQPPREPLEPSDTLTCLAYVSNRLNAQERAAFEQWMDADPLRRESVASLRRVWNVSGRFPLSVNTQGAWERVHQQMQDSPSRPTLRRARRSWRGFPVAIGTLGVAVVAMMFWKQGLSSFLPSSTTREHTYATHVGERATVSLNDGSRVTLAPKTVLTVAVGFGGMTRSVVLQGEAYFDVPNASRAPFLVHTGIVTTRVLGTRFDIAHEITGAKPSADTQRASVRVAVTQGRVQTRVAGYAPVTLSAGMIARTQDSVIAVTTETTADYVGWINGPLSFRNVPASEVFAALGRWYGIQFRVTDASLNQELVTGRFDFGNTADVIAALQATFGVRTTVTSRGDTTVVTLHGQHETVLPHHMPERTRILERFPLPLEMGR